MTVPFERTGPGQVGRLVYQVIGTNGPIPNPQRIRYLPPSATTLPGSLAAGGGVPSASTFMAYAQMANAGISLVNLGVSIAILAEVRKQGRVLRDLQTTTKRIEADVAIILERVQRIDVAVAEGHLRAELHHALVSASQNDEVDLVGLALHVQQALRRFEPAIGGFFPGCAPGLVLASDVRELAQAALNLLWAARRTVLDAHNRACEGDAQRVVAEQAEGPELDRIAMLTAMLAAVDQRCDEGEATLSGHLHETWRFFGGREHLLAVPGKQVRETLQADLGQLPGGADARQFYGALRDDDGLRAQAVRQSFSHRYLTSVLDAWAANTDAALLWRLARECAMQQDPAYWERCEGWMHDLGGTEHGTSELLDWQVLTAAR